MNGPVSEAHQKKCRSSGLNDETISLAGIYTERDRFKMYELLGQTCPERWKQGKYYGGDGLVFPFVEPGADDPIAHRVRPDVPRTKRDDDSGEEKPVKYESPINSGPLHYFPPRARRSNRFAGSATCFWTEGELKSLLLDQCGYCCVGLTGVWGAHDPKTRYPEGKPKRGKPTKTGPFVLHPRLTKHVRIAGRDHVIVFDSDIDDKPQVRLAAVVLARMLIAAGARSVRLASLPSPPSGEKLGVDDYYVLIAQRGESGAEALAKLFAESAPVDLDYEAKVAWKQGLIVDSEDRPTRCVANVMHVLATHPDFSGVLTYDDFRECTIKVRPPPTRAQDGSSSAGEWSDADTTRTAAWFASVIGFEPQTSQIDQGVAAIAERTRSHPVRDYLRSIEWDSTPRLDSMLATYFGAALNEYTKAVGSRWMIAAVARVMKPGCQVDCMLVLEGGQGAGKSRGLRALAGDSWFADTGISIGEKDSYQSLRSKWIYEFGELDAIKGREVTRVKSFVSSQSDNYRPSYGRRNRDFPRQCVFAGTTNEDRYLVDATGNRRFWPVRCGAVVKFDDLCRDRDQLWAEARVRFEKNERWHVDTPELRKLFEAAQGERRVVDPWLALVEKWLAHPTSRRQTSEGKWVTDSFTVANGVTTDEVLAHALLLHPKDMNQTASTRVGSILRDLEWVPTQKREDGARVRRYFPESHSQSQPQSDGGCDTEVPKNAASTPPVTPVTPIDHRAHMRASDHAVHDPYSAQTVFSGCDAVTGVTTAPSADVAISFATYYVSHPEELARWAAEVANDNGAPTQRPTGANSTAASWGRYYATHPEELRAAAAGEARPWRRL